jgi:hypothetical protein
VSSKKYWELGMPRAKQRCRGTVVCREFHPSVMQDCKKWIKMIFFPLFTYNIEQGFPAWGTRLSGGTWEVFNQWYFGYFCIIVGSQLVLGGTKNQKVGNPWYRVYIIDCCDRFAASSRFTDLRWHILQENKHLNIYCCCLFLTFLSWLCLLN